MIIYQNRTCSLSIQKIQSQRKEICYQQDYQGEFAMENKGVSYALGQW